MTGVLLQRRSYAYTTVRDRNFHNRPGRVVVLLRQDVTTVTLGMIDNIGGKLAESLMASLKKAGVSNQFCLKFSLHLICKLINIIFLDEVRT